MYIKLQRKNLPQFCLCVKIQFRISILEILLFYPPRGLPLWLLQLRSALSCWTPVQVRTLLLLEEGSGPLRTYSGEGVLVSWGGPESCVAA